MPDPISSSLAAASQHPTGRSQASHRGPYEWRKPLEVTLPKALDAHEGEPSDKLHSYW